MPTSNGGASAFVTAVIAATKSLSPLNTTMRLSNPAATRLAARYLRLRFSSSSGPTSAIHAMATLPSSQAID